MNVMIINQDMSCAERPGISGCLFNYSLWLIWNLFFLGGNVEGSCH